jgi:hypothetical protein
MKTTKHALSIFITLLSLSPFLICARNDDTHVIYHEPRAMTLNSIVTSLLESNDLISLQTAIETVKDFLSLNAANYLSRDALLAALEQTEEFVNSALRNHEFPATTGEDDSVEIEDIFTSNVNIVIDALQYCRCLYQIRYYLTDYCARRAPGRNGIDLSEDDLVFVQTGLNEIKAQLRTSTEASVVFAQAFTDCFTSFDAQAQTI